MKVLQIITKSNWGGAQKHVFDVTEYLKNHGVDVGVACGVERSGAPLVDRLTTLGVDVSPIRSLGRDIRVLGDIKSFVELIKILKKVRPDIIHLHSSKIGLLGSLAGRICGVKKIIFTAHGAVFEEDRNIFFKYILRYLAYLTAVLCHKTICVSQKDFDIYPKLFIKGKLVVIKNGISEPLFLAKSVAIDKLTINSSEDGLIIGTISELHPNKGHTYLLRAAKILKESNIKFQIHILGDGELFDELNAFINNNELSKNVFLHGFVVGAPQYLKSFDVFILSSIKEGLPYAILEAGLASLPIIGTNVGGIPEIIIDHETGLLVKSKDPVGIANAIKELSADKDLRVKLAKEIYQNVKTDYSAIKMLEGIIKIYRE